KSLRRSPLMEDLIIFLLNLHSTVSRPVFPSLNRRQIKILCGTRRKKSTDRFQWRSPHPRNHIHHKRKNDNRHNRSRNRHIRQLTVMGKPNLANEIKPHKTEDGYPQGQKNFPVQPVPVISQVYVRQKLQRQGQLQKAQNNLHAVQPPSRLWHGLQQRRKARKKNKRNRQGNRKSKHADRWTQTLPLGGRLYQQRPYDRTRARKRNQRQTEGHEEKTQQSPAVRLGVYLVNKRTW